MRCLPVLNCIGKPSVIWVNFPKIGFYEDHSMLVVILYTVWRSFPCQLCFQCWVLVTCYIEPVIPILFATVRTLRVSSLDTPSFDTPGPTFSIEVQVRLWYHNGQKQDKEYRVSKDDIGKYDMWLVRYVISSCSWTIWTFLLVHEQFEQIPCSSVHEPAHETVQKDFVLFFLHYRSWTRRNVMNCSWTCSSSRTEFEPYLNKFSSWTCSNSTCSSSDHEQFHELCVIIMNLVNFFENFEFYISSRQKKKEGIFF